jgi:hypothetical protein
MGGTSGTFDRSAHARDLVRMSFLLPQTHIGTVASARIADIHGDRYVDLAVTIEGAPVATGRVSVMECPEDLEPGERVSVRFTMGVMTRVERVEQ